MIKNKNLFFILLFFLLNCCSFDSKTGIWGEGEKEKKKNIRIRKATEKYY